MKLQRWSVALVALLAIGLSQETQAQTVLSETFTDVGALSGAGWVFQNNSTDAATLGAWQQGSASSSFNTGLPTGPAGAYLMSTFEGTSSTLGAGANLNDWILSPVLPLTNGMTLSFYTRTNLDADRPERLQLRISTSGPSTNVGSSSTDFGDYTTLLLDINPNLLSGNSNYPDTWTQFTVNLSGLIGTVNSRVAFRHFVEDAGINAPNADIIGVDNFEVFASAVPEPASLGMIATVAGAGWVVYRRRSRRLKKDVIVQ